MIRLVIADDEPITRTGLSQLDWEDEGFTLSGVAANGLEALTLIRNVSPDLLLTDIRMPGLDGLELMSKIRDEQPELKVIFITAYHQMDSALRAIDMGAVGFVLKPTEPEEILEVCRKARRQIEAERERVRLEEGLKSQLKEYTMKLQEKIHPEGEASLQHQAIREIVAYMSEQYREDITIEQMAKRYHFNPDYLSRLFKKETGDTILNTLTRIRMQKAVELLAKPEIKVYEVADQVGIHDTRYFGQMFKKRYGTTPNEFRKSLFEHRTQEEES